MVAHRRAAPLTRWLLGTFGSLALAASVACSTADGDGTGGGKSGSGSGSGATAGTTGGSGGASGGSGGASATGGTSAGSTGAGGAGGSASSAGAGGAGGAGATAGSGGSGGSGDAGGSGGTATAGTGAAGMATGGAGGGSGGGVTDTVTRSASTYAFRHFPIQVNGDGVWNGPMVPAGQPTTTSYDTIVLENGYLRVTLLPSYGGRVLSILHKPTNRELLYQNPLGTPYLMLEDIFYYDYLVIMGGIFPSFPEPEHGRYWNQPYDFEVTSESPEAITVRMSRKDDRGITTGVPARYDVGRTDVLVQLDVTLRAGSTALELATKLTNTRGTAVPSFEYWTVTTLAPGSPPGQTAIGLNTQILASMAQVHLLESSWAWFGQAEERVTGEVFKWNNLSRFENWEDQGTAFANPSYTANWSGLLNDDNDTTVLRVSDNVETPGLKLWTFGKQSLSIDIDDAETWLRPTIEMWHGVTPEFWTRGTMAANEARTWTDHYFPTFGMSQVTAASEHGAMLLSRTTSGPEASLTARATLTLPNQTVRAVLRLDGSVVAEESIVVPATDAAVVTATLPASSVPAGAVLAAEFFQGDTSLLSGQTTLN